MSDLVTRLRQAAHTLETDSQAWEQLAALPALQAGQRRTIAVLAEAADEIQRLRAEIGETKASCMTFGGALVPNECSLLDNIKMLKGDIDTLLLQAERDEARARLDRADCTHREGGDTRHCRHDRLCWHCRHVEAVALLKEVTERWLLDELCGRYRVWCNSCQELKARLDAFLAKVGKGER